MPLTLPGEQGFLCWTKQLKGLVVFERNAIRNVEERFLAVKLVVNINSCYACRTCELACSFHHSKTFSPEISSIKVTTNVFEGRICANIDSSCDLCADEKVPMCIMLCPYGAIKEK